MSNLKKKGILKLLKEMALYIIKFAFSRLLYLKNNYLNFQYFLLNLRCDCNKNYINNHIRHIVR